MIAMLLIAQLGAAQLSADVVRGMPADAIVAGPANSMIRVYRTLPPKACPGAGRMEASNAEPAALYRKGDRPARRYLKWADYPDGRFCHLGGAK